MKNNIKITIYVIISLIVISLLVVSILYLRKNLKSDNDKFVQHYLKYLDEGSMEIEFTSVVIYVKDQKAFLEINYNYNYNEIKGRQRFMVNRETRQYLQGGFEDSNETFLKEFEYVKENYKEIIFYSMEEIARLLDD